jgi:RHS repeat-associated protein
MFTPSRFRKFLLLFLWVFAGQGISSAQSLSDVVLSLSDRQRVISQRSQVSTYLSNQHSSAGDPVQPLPADNPIDWIGVGKEPSESDVEGLDIGGRIALLNQAVGEFDRLLTQFYNSSPAEFESGAIVGALRNYTTADFDPLPRATPENYNTLIRSLAQRVRALRLVSWSSWYNQTTLTINTTNKVDNFNSNPPAVWKPNTIGTNSPGAVSDTFSDYGSNLDVRIGGDYSSENSSNGGLSQSQTINVSVNYPTSAQVIAMAPRGTGTQIDGRIYILHRSSWHELAATGLSPQFNKNEAGYVIDGSNAAGNVPLFTSPASVTLEGTWITTSLPSDSRQTQKFVPNGYKYLQAYTLPTTDPGYSDNYIRANEQSWEIGSGYYGSIMKPTFTRGIDAPDMILKMESANGVFAIGNSDGNLILRPRPRLLFGIDLGSSLRGGEHAYVSVRPMRLRGGYGSQEYQDVRFDSAYALYFAGSHSDYHVVYENDRTSRSQSLPDLFLHFIENGRFNQARSNLYKLWDSPRLKQIAGRDLVTNIVYGTSHYGGYTITVYRRAQGSALPMPGQLLDVSGLTQIRTWSFSHPGAGIQEYLDDAENLEVTGSAGEVYEIKANEVPPVGGYPTMSWSYAFPVWWFTLGTYSWTLKLSQGTIEKYRENISILTTVNAQSYRDHDVSIEKLVDGQLVSKLTAMELDPFGTKLPDGWKITTAGKTITGTATFTNYSDKFPTSISLQYDGIQPDAAYTWDSNGLLSSAMQGLWTMTGSMEAGAYKQIRKYNGSTVATDWTEFLTGHKIKTSSAPDGTVAVRSDPSVAWTEVEYGSAANGLPGLPRIVKNSDGTGTTYDWATGANGAYILTQEQGLLAGNTVSRGSKLIYDVNASGQPNKVESFVNLGGSLKTAGTVFSNPNARGLPRASMDYNTGLGASWDFDGIYSRLASHTSPLGVVSSFSNYDLLGRPAAVSRSGISAAMTYEAFSQSAILSGAGSGSSSETRDNLGRLTASSLTWNGVSDSSSLTHASDSVAISQTNSLLGSHQTTLRSQQGTVASASGPTLPFGGTTGDALSVANGLLKSQAQVAGQTAAAFTSLTDAWGRLRSTTRPANSSSGTTSMLYSAPSSSLQRVALTEPSGRKTLTESDPYNTAGAVSRSGIDVNENGTLDATDRYVESTTSVISGKLVTVLKLSEDSGLREILRTEWNPNGNQTVTKINGTEETLTRTPNATAKTISTTSSKGWSKTESYNNLGLTTSSTLTGTGLPTATLTPTWRADGSLSGVTFTAAGDTHSATLNPNGTLATLTAPGRGNILGSHSISSSGETLTVDGITTATKLDGTQTTTSGSDLIGKTDTLATSGSGFKQTTHPATGADTTRDFHASGEATAKNYAVGIGESYTYQSGRLSSISLAGGGSLQFGYSSDGAKDLTSATWPALTSGPFNLPALSQVYGYNRAGRLKSIGDASGARAITYQNGRPAATTYTAGALTGYKLVRGVDTSGRDTGFTLYQGSTAIHSVGQASNGVSGEISAISSGTFSASFSRDAARNLTSISRGSVTQSWSRGAAGRLLSASSNVAGASSFNYRGTANNEATAFDPKGRRLKSATTGGEWTYQYTNGQLTSATHPTLGNFTYPFDGIGRRTNMGSATSADLLNRTLAWTNNQSKTLSITAAPTAQVWFNGTQIPNFTGSYRYPVPSPGSAGGWVAWETLAVLPGQGDAGANPDAKAEKKGSVWIPPVSETFAYDSAGNRLSSALWDLGWDAKNQLARARTKNFNTAAQGYDITCDYDAEGRRFRKKVTRYQSGTVAEQKNITFLHDGTNLIYERQQLASGLTILERKYVWGPDISGGNAGGAGGLLLIRETKGDVTTDLYPLYDGSGNVTALASSTGTLLAEYAYGPFGELIYARGPSAASCPFRFATKYYDQETGYYHFGKRFYDPVTGQFLSREPLGESESLNLYSYCHNDPINYVDDLGLAERSLLYHLFYGFDPITLEPSSKEIERRQAGMQEHLRFIRFLKEFEKGQMDTKEFPLAMKEAFIRQQVELNKLYQQRIRDADLIASGPQIKSIGESPPMVSVAALSIGGATTEFNASINSDWLLPTGAGTAGAKFLFGGMKTMLPVLAAGARTEAKLLTTEMRAGEMATVGEVKSASTYVQIEFPFAKGASIQTPVLTKEGETFVRVGAKPQNLKFGLTSLSGVQPGTYAFPQATFDAIGTNPIMLKNVGDLPGAAPQYFRTLSPPPGIPIQRGIVPGGEYGGIGGIEEVIFPKGF